MLVCLWVNYHSIWGQLAKYRVMCVNRRFRKVGFSSISYINKVTISSIRCLSDKFVVLFVLRKVRMFLCPDIISEHDSVDYECIII